MVAKKKRRIILLAVLAIVLAALVVWMILENTSLELNTYTITSRDLPAAFDQYRIAHISDLHNTEIGAENEKLLTMLREAKPDMIAITGDLIDSRNTKLEIALHFAGEAAKIAPCYYVTGNHEARVAEYDALKKGLTELGVVVLEDESLEIERSGEKITLLGVEDPSFQTDYLFGDAATLMRDKLDGLRDKEAGYQVLLSHRPELFDIYVESGVDMVLSGHAHGGQFRLPFVGGVFAPNQGLFPAYDAGIYEAEETTMIVSRGIGNSLVPFRINNRPEIVLIELTQKD